MLFCVGLGHPEESDKEKLTPHAGDWWRPSLFEESGALIRIEFNPGHNISPNNCIVLTMASTKTDELQVTGASKVYKSS